MGLPSSESKGGASDLLKKRMREQGRERGMEREGASSIRHPAARRWWMRVRCCWRLLVRVST